MKIAVLSDIHGNSTALNAVLNDLPPVDDIVSLGDVIGYGPHPSEAIEIIREHASVSLYGNHEKYLVEDVIVDNHGANRGIEYTRSQLSKKQLLWCENRPMQAVVDGSFRIVHGHPDPKTPFKYVSKGNVTGLIPYYEEEENAMAVGHSHEQFQLDLSKFQGGGGLFFNPGSVGQPRDGDPRAAYAVVDTNDATVDLRRVEYDIESVIKDVIDADLPEVNGTRLRC